MPSAIATAESRVMRSRAHLRERVHRVGIALARPAALAGAAAAGALVGFATARLRANALTSALGAGLRLGVSRYVRYRTAQRETPSQDAAHG
jgi:hypothetical protein